MTKRFIFALLSIAPAAIAQLHLIAGSPMPTYSERFAANLFRVTDDGHLELVQELAPKDPGVAAVTISYDVGIALIQSSRLIVVDLAKAQVVKTCALGKGPKESIWVYSWLLNVPSIGAVLAESFADSKENRTTIMGTLTDPTMPCDKSRIILDHSDLRYIAALGTPLIADIGGSDSAGLFTLLDAAGIVKGSDSGISYSYGYQVPPAELDGISRPSNIWLGINNSEMMVIVLHDKSGEGRVLGIRKKDSTWHRVPVPTLRPLTSNAWVPLPVMRAFGHFLAMAEVLPKDARNPVSAGGAEWRKVKGTSGPEMDFLYRNNAQLDSYAFNRKQKYFNKSQAASSS